MKTLMTLVNRNQKLYFKDKGMFFTSLITPMILIVLYATFLAQVYKDSFHSAMPETITISEKLINGTVAAQLTAALLAVSCITVTFCVNLTMVQDKTNNVLKDFNVSPISKGTLYLSYFIATYLNALIVNMLSLVLCLGYIKYMGWYLSIGDVLVLITDIMLLVLFGTVIASICCCKLKTQGQMSAVGTIVSSGYGFVCGAYMPISNFGTGLQNVLKYLPSTYTTSLLKNHMLNGVFKEMKSIGFPKDVVNGIAKSLDCRPELFNHVINTSQMYLMILATIVICALLYVVILKVSKES